MQPWLGWAVETPVVGVVGVLTVLGEPVLLGELALLGEPLLGGRKSVDRQRDRVGRAVRLGRARARVLRAKARVPVVPGGRRPSPSR